MAIYQQKSYKHRDNTPTMTGRARQFLRSSHEVPKRNEVSSEIRMFGSAIQPIKNGLRNKLRSPFFMG